MGRTTKLTRPAKRGHIVAATLLTWSYFPNADSFCHARNICCGHIKCLWKSSATVLCVRAARNNVAAFCHRRATSQDKMLPPQSVLVLPVRKEQLQSLLYGLLFLIFCCAWPGSCKFENNFHLTVEKENNKANRTLQHPKKCGIIKYLRYHARSDWLDYRARWEYIKRWRVHHFPGLFAPRNIL